MSGLAVLSRPISSIIFGQKWHGIEIVIALIGFMHSVGWFVGINPEAYRAVGRPILIQKFADSRSDLLYSHVYFCYTLWTFCLLSCSTCCCYCSNGTPSFWSQENPKFLPFTYLGHCIKSPLIGCLIMAIVVHPAANLLDGSLRAGMVVKNVWNHSHWRNNLYTCFMVFRKRHCFAV